MIVSIHQPQYLPWLGYFDKIEKSDIFIFLDNVQFKKNEWQNRNKIKTAQDWQWLTVPVIHKYPQKILEVKINNRVPWSRKHLSALITNYSKAPFYKEYIDFFEQTYARNWGYLADINIQMIKYLTTALGISEKKFIKASKYEVREDGTERLIDLCKHVGGDIYLSGKDGAKYLNLDKFKEEGIKVIFQDYNHPQYPQLYGSFEPYLSVIDLLFNCGQKSLSILKGGE
ncbi:MAG: WbqC family protein [Candidatus Aminicenantaceae bacterium]